jgi:hypothetical protein
MLNFIDKKFASCARGPFSVQYLDPGKIDFNMVRDG